jgi:hypothetical protein
VFGWEKGNLDSYRPNQKQTRDFIDYLIFAIRSENKARSPERCLALSKVLSYYETPGKVCFSGVDPSVFAFQLALRIREPSLLNQKSLGACGAASLMTSFAKHNPAGLRRLCHLARVLGKAHKLEEQTLRPPCLWSDASVRAQVQNFVFSLFRFSSLAKWKVPTARLTCCAGPCAGAGLYGPILIQCKNHLRMDPFTHFVDAFPPFYRASRFYRVYPMNTRPRSMNRRCSTAAVLLASHTSQSKPPPSTSKHHELPPSSLPACRHWRRLPRCHHLLAPRPVWSG